MSRFLLLFVLFFGLTYGLASAATPKTTTDTISLTWSRMIDCVDNKATFQFNVPYPYTDVDSFTVNLDDGQGALPYRANWTYNYIRYISAGPKNIRLWIKKKDGNYDSLKTTINIVDTRVLFGFPARDKFVSYDSYPFTECAPTMENTVVSHRWEFQQRIFDGDCIEVKYPGMYIRQTTSANCDRYIKDTIYIKTKDYVRPDFLIVDSSLINCGMLSLINTSFTPSGIASAQWVFEGGKVVSGINLPQPIPINYGPNRVKLIVTANSGVKDSVEKFIFAEFFRPDRVRLVEDSAIHVGDTLRVNYDQFAGSRPPYAMPPYKVEWSTGATTREIKVTEPGKYWVKVTPCPQNPSLTFSDTLVLDKFRLTLLERHNESSPAYFFGTNSNYYCPGTYHWDFGDSTTFTGEFANHVYKRAGTYLVTVYREDSKGRRDSAKLSIVVAAQPLKADFTSQQVSERTLRFTGTATGTQGHAVQYEWYWGDGNYGNDSVVAHTYNAAGTYNVTLVVWDPVTNMMDTLRKNVVVWPQLDLGKDTVFRGAPISLQINPPFYGDTAVHCVWQPGGSTAKQLTVTAPGSYVARIYTPDGYTVADTIQVLSDPATVVDSFRAVRDNDGKLTMVFTANQSAQIPGMPYWTFGDAPYADSGVVVRHTYVQPGHYDVKMWRGGYLTDTVRKKIFIAPPISLNLGPDKMLPDSQHLVLDGNLAVDSFYNRNPDVTWQWSTGATFNIGDIWSPGVYWLRASAYGFVSTDTIRILPNPGISPGMSWTSKEGDASKIYFENTSQIPNISTISWSFGDGSPDAGGPAVAHTFAQPGTYNVKLQVSTYTGYVYAVTEKVKVWPALDLGPDTTYRGTPIQLKVNEPYFSDTAVACVWSPGDVSGKYMTANQSGVYYVKVTAPHYIGVDTVHVKNGSVWDNFDFAQNNGLFLVRFVTYHFNGYRGPTHWSFGDGSVTDTSLVVDHQFPGPGTYTVKMWKGFDLKDTVNMITKQVTLLPLVTVNLGPDQRMKDSSGITLDAEAAVDPIFKGDRQISWKWSTGEESRVVTLKLPGIYTLTATRYGISATDTIEILPPLPNNPTGSMIYTSRPGDASKLYFENTSQITGLSATRWSFGDGTGDFVTASRTTEHTFTQPGTYIVTMQSETNDGNRFTITEQVKVWPPLDLGPDVTYNGPTIELKVNDPYFYDPAVNVVWYPDVVSGKYLRVSKAGTYYAKVTAPHYEGVDTIHVLKGTFLDDFSYAVNTGNRLSYNFAPYVAPGDARMPYWLFGDGSPKDSGTFVTHVFPAYGDYRVKMWKGAGNGDTIIKVLKVIPALVADFSYTVNNNTKEVTFTNVSQNMDEGQFRSEWEFGDGATAVLEGKSNLIITHRYATTGNYRVRMKVRDNIAGTGDTTKLITVAGLTLPPKAAFDNKRANDGLYTMNFTNTSVVKTGNASAFWRFGDGTTATGWNTTHTYAAPGTYLVQLLVQDSLGLKDSVTQSVYIRSKISVDLGPDAVLRNGQPIQLEGYEAIGGAMNDINWLWSTGDTTHRLQITAPGTYWLRATMYGQIASDTIVISTPPPPPPVVDGSAAVVQVKDSVPVTVTFPIARQADNVYSIQLANADNGPIPGVRAGEPVVTDIISFPSTSAQVSVKVKLPDNLPCGKQYRIRIVSSSPAESTAWSQPFEVKNMPAIPLIAQRGDTLESSAAMAYQWYRNGVPVQGATSRSIRAKADGSYQVQVSAGGDCQAISSPLAMVITGLGDVTLTASPLTVYPNPSSGAVYLQLEKQPAQPLLIHVYNISGRIVHSLLMKDKQTVMDLSHMPKGLYYVQVSGRERQKPVLISIQ